MGWNKKQTGRFLGMLLGTLGSSLLGNTLSGVLRGGIIRAAEGTLKASGNFWCHFILYLILRCYQNKTQFTGVYSKDNLPK